MQVIEAQCYWSWRLTITSISSRSGRYGGIGSGAAFCLGLDAGEGGADRRLPCGGDPSGPPLACDCEVGAELAGILQPGRAILLGEGEFLGEVGHRAAHLLAPGPACPLGGQRLFPAGRQRPPSRFADIRDTRNRFAISRSLAPASISSAAASRTRSRRARSAAVSPPPSGYLMTPAYRGAAAITRGGNLQN